MSDLDQLPQYRSHKVVRAAPMGSFEGIEDGKQIVRLALSEGHSLRVGVDQAVFARRGPEPGDYLVVYDDGYISWSPKAAFEGGYTLLAAETGAQQGAGEPVSEPRDDRA